MGLADIPKYTLKGDVAGLACGPIFLRQVENELMHD